jgi:hypothetical protein
MLTVLIVNAIMAVSANRSVYPAALGVVGLFRRLTTGKFCFVAERPVNIGPSMLQKSVAKMKGKRAIRSAGAGLGLVAKLCCRRPWMFHGSDSSGPEKST